jgi:hemolysin III
VSSIERPGVAEPPLFRGFVHLAAFVLAVPFGLVLVLAAPNALSRGAALIFALAVVGMFGVSTLFHRLRWTPAAKSRMAVLDHTMIYALIAGTYTPFALLVLRPGWSMPVLVAVWTAALIAGGAKIFWRNAPPWVAAVVCITIGWSALVVFPQIVARIGVVGASLLVAGGVAYTVGAVVYARRRPDPFPRTFGYHEIFHALVVIAVSCQFATVAFFVLPTAA